MSGGQGKAGVMTMTVAVVVMALLVVDGAHGWGSYTCNIREGDYMRLSALCDKEESVTPKLDFLSQKMSAVLEALRGLTHLEDNWLGIEHDAHKTSSPVERDLSKHAEETLEFARIDKDYIETLGETMTTEVPTTTPTTTTTTTTTTTEMPTTTMPEFIQEEMLTKGECHAKEIPKHETVGLFYMTSFRHGHCANRRATEFPVRFCLGYCATRTFIDRAANMWTHGDKCSSCQPHLLETVRIPLVCEDGYTFHRTFENIVECECKGCRSAEV